MGLFVHHTDIIQTFTYGDLDPNHQIYWCLPHAVNSQVLKLERSVNGLRQVQADFKDKLSTFVKSAKCTPFNDADTMWVLRKGTEILINACYVDDVLHFTKAARFYLAFCKSFQKESDVESSDDLIR